MNIWYIDNWKKFSDLANGNCKKGLRLHFGKDIDQKARKYFMDFSKWIRREFAFPIRINVYVKGDYKIKAKDGDMVCGLFRYPTGDKYPYILLAVGDYKELVESRGEEQAMWSILWSFAHELTHYYQYINDVQLSSKGEEIQATRYSKQILEKYDYEMQQKD